MLDSMIQEITDNNISSVESFLKVVAPEQVEFVLGDYFSHGRNFYFGWFEGGSLCGFISYCIQKIGQEQKTQIISRGSEDLNEAKISGFAVATSFRNKGIGRKLQKHVIEHAKNNDCYQLTSYSTIEKVENYAVKLSLGFCVQPEVQSDGTQGCYFLKRL